ncbi:ESX-1 secretion-associated protein EspK, partial [Mycobacterium tuberculosis NRITLD12]
GRGVACCHWAGAGGYLGQGGGTEHAGGLGADGIAWVPPTGIGQPTEWASVASISPAPAAYRVGDGPR